MPTGYTNYILDDVDFKTFVLTCARAFGATISMRDDPLDAEIPEFKVSTWYLDEHKKAEKCLHELRQMKKPEIKKICDEDFEMELASHKERLDKKANDEKKYRAMLGKVLAWNPPSEDHKELKTFMIKQIEDSIKFDCGTGYLPVPKKKSVDEWYNEKIEKCLHDIEYYRKEHMKEVDRVNGQNTWVKQLRKSLDGE